MKNVSFDNPYLLLLAIPLLLLILIPFIIAIRKENRSKSTVASLVIHIAIVVLVTLAAAGMMVTTILTETTVYVVADVSDSGERNLDLIDEYINDMKENLPKNTKLGVVCFGENAEVLFRPGEESKSVKESSVVKTSTNIVNAIKFTKELFPKDSINKMVLISDGKDTDTNSRGKLVSEVELLNQSKITLDAIFLDNNLKDDEKEVQLSDVERAETVYLNSQASARALIQTNFDGTVKLTLSVKAPESGEYVEAPFTMHEAYHGYNLFEIPLKTDKAGIYDYRLEVSSTNDIWTENNVYTFSQEVKTDMRVFLLTGLESDVTALKSLYGENATIDSFIVNKKKQDDVPFTVEELCKYDQFVISNVDIRNVTNITSILNSIETLVSQFGKSLTTMGNLEIQNKIDNTLGALGEMLPVNYGNANEDEKLYILVLDSSHSMNQAGKLEAMKIAAKALLTLLNDEDKVAVVTFSGDVETLQPTVDLGENREKINDLIDGIKPTQGTYLGTGLERAYSIAKLSDAKEKQVMLISDGKTNKFDINPETVASKMGAYKIVASTINMLNTQDEDAEKLLGSIATKTGGKYHPVADIKEINEIVFSDVADELTEAIVEAESSVNIEQIMDALLIGDKNEKYDDIEFIENIFGFVQTSEKVDAKTILTVDYVKEDDVIIKVPLYSYREYGNGRVITFTSSLSNGWLDGWTDEFKTIFFGNMLKQNTPDEKVEYPFEFEVQYDGMYSKVLVSPASLHTDAQVLIKIASPTGEILTITKAEAEGEIASAYSEALFDTQRYYYIVESSDIGRYDIEIVYNYNKKGDGTYSSTTAAKAFFNVSYAPEYNAFETFSPASLQAFVSGTVYEGEAPVITNNDNELATYEYRFTIPFLIIAMILFLIDIAVRVLKFSRKPKAKGGKA